MRAAAKYTSPAISFNWNIYRCTARKSDAPRAEIWQKFADPNYFNVKFWHRFSNAEENKIESL